MQERYLYEYAVLRVVPRVEREEFINIGVVLFCQPRQFLKVRYELNVDRLKAVFPDLDQEELSAYCRSFASICEGNRKGGSLESMPAAARFRWLTAKRSTILQVSAVHPGFCTDPDETLENLMDKLVR